MKEAEECEWMHVYIIEEHWRADCVNAKSIKERRIKPRIICIAKHGEMVEEDGEE